MKIFRHIQRHCSNIKTCKGSIRDTLLETTQLTRDHLTPEIPLHLITPKCKLWYSNGDDLPFPDPYWAFFWPGGQALTRYILDQPHLFKNKNVVDIGSGCGASAIACKLVGAQSVMANDIDKVAVEAIKLNASVNNISINVCSDNLIGRFDSDWDIILLGDMFYDSCFVNIISNWIPRLSANGISVYIGDPGRLPLIEHPLKSNLEKTSQYELPANCLKENNGMDTGYVWKFIGKLN